MRSNIADVNTVSDTVHLGTTSSWACLRRDVSLVLPWSPNSMSRISNALEIRTQGRVV